MFLMHRVELKVPLGFFYEFLFELFLMHRVELKVQRVVLEKFEFIPVPNAPCGVERKSLQNSKKFHQVRS